MLCSIGFTITQRRCATRYNRLGKAFYRNSITSLNDNLAQQYMLQGLIGKEVPATKEDFDAYRQSVIDAAVSSGQFIGTNEEIAASVDGVLKSQSRFSSFYADELNDAGGAAAQVEKAVEEGEIVFTHAQLVGMIENARNGIQGALESIVQSLVDSIPAVSNVMNSIANDNSKTDNSSEVISPHVEINFTHSGFMSEADLKKYGKIIGDMTIERIIEPFRRNGLMNTRKSRLRPG